LKKEQETEIKEMQVLNIDTPERSKVGNLMTEDVPVLFLQHKLIQILLQNRNWLLLDRFNF
jgi:hypothetical protein